MNYAKLTDHERAIALQARIEERALIIYVNESALADDELLDVPYQQCLKDEIENHQANMAEYKKELKQLKQKSK